MNVFSFAPLYRIINVLKSILSFIVRIFYSKKITKDDNSDDIRQLEVKIGDGSSVQTQALGSHVSCSNRYSKTLDLIVTDLVAVDSLN